MYKYLKCHKGFINILVAILVIVIFGCAALAVDIGMLGYEKSKLQNTCDAVALACGQKIGTGNKDYDNTTRIYIALNNENNVNYSATEITREYYGKVYDGIRVDISKQIPHSFARVLGVDKSNISAFAVACKLTGYGVRPFGVFDPADGYTEGDDVTLKYGASDGDKGWFGLLRIDPGSIDLTNKILNGCNTTVTTYPPTNIVEDKTGVVFGPIEDGITQLINSCYHQPKCTKDDFELDCPRVITVPIVEKVPDEGYLKVIKFAQFFVVGLSDDDGNGQKEVESVFVRYLDVNEIKSFRIKLVD